MWFTLLWTMLVREWQLSKYMWFTLLLTMLVREWKLPKYMWFTLSLTMFVREWQLPKYMWFTLLLTMLVREWQLGHTNVIHGSIDVFPEKGWERGRFFGGFRICRKQGGEGGGVSTEKRVRWNEAIIYYLNTISFGLSMWKCNAQPCETLLRYSVEIRLEA